jgi:hypothetical protein
MLLSFNIQMQIWYFVDCALSYINLLKPTDYVMHHQFNIQQMYSLPTLYFFLYLSENKQRLAPVNTKNRLLSITEIKSVYSAVRTWSLNKAVCSSYLKVHRNLHAVNTHPTHAITPNSNCAEPREDGRLTPETCRGVDY